MVFFLIDLDTTEQKVKGFAQGSIHGSLAVLGFEHTTI